LFVQLFEFVFFIGGKLDLVGEGVLEKERQRGKVRREDTPQQEQKR
jgi:hypothetical protein